MAETLEIEKIGFDVPILEVYPTFTERYFTPRYVLNVHGKGDDICVLFHSNRVCLITLAPSHPVLAENKKIVKVDFEASDPEGFEAYKKRKHRKENTNRLNNHVRGKKKRGAQILHKLSLLCTIECEDGSIYCIRSGIPGLLVEVNESLIENPNLLLEKPTAEGYIAIMLPKTLESDRLRDKLMTPEQYQKAVEEQDNPEPEHNQETKEASIKKEEEEESIADPVKNNEIKSEIVDTYMEQDQI